MSILYGNRDGTFQAPVDITTGVNDPNAVVVGDFNGDGRLDIAVANEGDETVSVLLNTGNDVSGRATFAPAPGSPFSLAPSSNGPIDGMTTANLTGHGNVDLVLSTSPTSEGSGMCGTSDCVQVLTNVDDRSGNFNAVAAYSVGGEGQVAAADVRGTGVDDVLVPMDVTNGTGTGGFEVLHNDGTGALDPPAMFTYPVSENPRALVVGDFTNDGKLDVAMADFTSNITVLFEGNGDGTFTYDDTGPDPEHLQESDNTLAAADFNGDLSSTLPPARTTAGWS
ncbi:MAG: VCBS repeat-containing protein [Solirubrobacterales bacterium]|nr:VCBS repeat-containing protein [Solirubrobacterales bacterium]